MTPTEPEKITDNELRFDSFKSGKSLEGKKNGRLPAMGWNSWNAFGSGNTEALTKAMADAIVELGLDKFGYKYVVLDDGCYKSERENGKLANEPVKFPGGFKALSDYVHARGLKFGMYNDIGTNLCAGAFVGTCGFEETDAKSYIDWGVDFLKIDNCYYLWDNATFSNPENARYVFAPNIKGIELKPLNKDGASQADTNGNLPESIKLSATDGTLTGKCAYFKDGYATGIGTFDGTNTGTTPVGDMSGELTFEVNVENCTTEYELIVEYATARVNGCGEWLQVAVNHENNGETSTEYFYDNLLTQTKSPEDFAKTSIKIKLSAGKNKIRLMNHRRQENTLCSYAAMLFGLNKAQPGHDTLISLCEWGKTQPQNWGYKVGSSWRILNDITFRVGSDGNPGFGRWEDPGTPSVTSQYNKAVVMDEFAGLEKGWNDPDMLMIGMNELTLQMNQTHFTMWCMMNSPLMLGLDLRRVKKGDELYNIISNRELIALNQDKLGIQAKRIFTTAKLPECSVAAYNQQG
ncbi:MAG: alpha-galactosidase, partial [Treponema sp.]|nr:alpha-galactosidase [Treponema sp.]